MTVNRTVARVGLLALCAITAAAGAASLKDIASRERAATNFKDLKVGQQVPPDTLAGAIFNAPGAVMFLDNPAFYLEGSNRSWGFSGPGAARISFSRPMRSVSLVARGSAGDDTKGPLFKKAPLAEAEGLVTAITSDGRRLPPIKLENVSVRSKDAKVITMRSARGIRAIELRNRAGAANAIVVISGIGATPLRLTDVTADGVVTVDDVVETVLAIGTPCGPTKSTCPDSDGDGVVDPKDLAHVVADLGTAF